MKLKQQLKTPTSSQLNSHSNLIIVLPKEQIKSKWPVFPHSNTIMERLNRAGKKCTASPFSTDLPNKIGTHATIVCIKKDISSFELLTLCRKAAGEQLKQNPREIALYMPGMEAEPAIRTAEAMLATLLAACYEMPSYKSKKSKPLKLNSLVIYNLPEEQDFDQTFAEAEGNNLARYLTALPPNDLTPALYRKRITTLAKEYGWKMDFLDMKALRKKKAGAFVAVAQGSPVDDAGIVHLRYKPRSKSKLKKLALVGKGICFDTGGMNLKPAQYMHGMHEDMEGSAVALGTLIALTELEVNFEIDCWLALAQNHIG
ncbi:MAG: M17 family metallopeptidase, partial [Gammaproteobacteria bacterium]|nr:M17 family metallopeptidase [Gammaproteobacteria bacterium]